MLLFIGFESGFFHLKADAVFYLLLTYLKKWPCGTSPVFNPVQPHLGAMWAIFRCVLVEIQYQDLGAIGTLLWMCLNHNSLRDIHVTVIIITSSLVTRQSSVNSRQSSVVIHHSSFIIHHHHSFVHSTSLSAVVSSIIIICHHQSSSIIVSYHPSPSITHPSISHPSGICQLFII